MFSDWSNVDDDLRFLPSWLMLERWLSASDPARGSGLRAGATEEDISAVEQMIGASLPAVIRFAYLRHNGEEYDSFGLFGGWRWLPLIQVAKTWLSWQRHYGERQAKGGRRAKASRRPDRPATVRAGLWHPGWIPLSHNGGRDHHCVDLCPGEAGVVGQIIEWPGEPVPVVVAQSFEEWLAVSFADLANGKWEFSRVGNLVVGRGKQAEPCAAPDAGPKAGRRR